MEQMQYLYVRVVEARDMALFGGVELVAEVNLGNYRGITKRAAVSNAEWDQVFAFPLDCIQSSVVEISVKESNKKDYMGRVWFDLSKVPIRVPLDSQLAPKWYRMEDNKGDDATTGVLMISIWFGTQADEVFEEAWHPKATNVHFDGFSSKVYLSPKLWYLRVVIIEAQDIMPGHEGSELVRFPEFSTRVQVGNQILRTGNSARSATRSFSSPYWNEELLFVVAEPFENDLLVSVEDRVLPERDVVVAEVLLPMATIEKRADEKPVTSRWFNLDSQFGNAGDNKKLMTKFVSRIHLRVSFDEWYDLLDEGTTDSCDVRPSSQIGVLEMGILGVTDLMPEKTEIVTFNAYCIAKYGKKWVRTRTVVDSLSPKWNEDYTWQVYDPCSVVTIGVFDSSRITTNYAGNCDYPIGKVRIRLSTLENDRVYSHSYPLLMLYPSGFKKMGVLHLNVRFSCVNVANMLHKYTMPLLPRMHYMHPLSVDQLESLRYQAINVVASKFSRAEPPLGRELVEYMHESESDTWSMRKSRANHLRLMNVLSSCVAILSWLEEIRNWQKPVHSVFFLIFFLALVMLPELIIPTTLFYMVFRGLQCYRYRSLVLPHMDPRLSHADSQWQRQGEARVDDGSPSNEIWQPLTLDSWPLFIDGVFADELDEESDTFPTRGSADVVRCRYDRLRSLAATFQSLMRDVAAQGERFHALLNWKDPRATFLFMVFCGVAASFLYVVPIRFVVVLFGFYSLRPPRFRSKLPSPVVSFFKRLPTKDDSFI